MPALTNLSEDQRCSIVLRLLEHSNHGRLQRGEISAVAEKYGRTRQTIARLWKRFVDSGKRLDSIKSKIKAKSGRKCFNRDELQRRIATVLLRKRMRLRSLAKALNVSVALLHRMLRDSHLRRHTNKIHPALTDANRAERVKFAVSHVTRQDNVLRFDDMFDVVHIDEKWFNEDVDDRTFYLVPGEDEPARARKSKRFIGKTMFLCAVARTRFDYHRKCMFNGKSGCWPLLEERVAIRSSCNRPAGTVELKNVPTVDRAYSREMLVHHVIPAIKAAWPRQHCGRKIYIQQDKSHVLVDDPEVFKAGQADGWDTRVRPQPPNLTRHNVLDLGFFASIQALQYEVDCRNTKELIAAVESAFKRLKWQKLDNIFLTLQKVFECIMLYDGRNDFKFPHAHKERLRRANQLPVSFVCDEAAYTQAVAFANVPQWLTE